MLRRLKKPPRNDGFIGEITTVLETIANITLSAHCHPAWQISAGKSTEIFAVPPHNPTAQGRIKAGAMGQARAESLDAAAIKIFVAFYKELRSNLLYR